MNQTEQKIQEALGTAKKCSGCGEVKSLSNFPSPGRFVFLCNTCLKLIGEAAAYCERIDKEVVRTNGW